MNDFETYKYSIHQNALKKWATNNLQSKKLDSKQVHYFYNYQGSSCKNGGVPFSAILHIVILSNEDTKIIKKAWVEIPADQQENAKKMCSYPGDSFDLLLNTEIENLDLELALRKELKENFAGCLCNQDHRNQKLRMILETIHYSLYKNV